MKKELQVRKISARPGARAYGILPFGNLLDGTPIGFHIILVNGKFPGPTFGLFACMYGNAMEQSYEQGIEIIRRITRVDVDPAQLHGQIIACSVINPMAFNTRTINAVEDEIDMQQSFPGNAQGSLTQRGTFILYQECVKQCSVVMNFHAKTEIDWSVVFSHSNKKTYKQSLSLAESYGTPIMIMPGSIYNKTLCVSAMDLGIPSFLSEPTWPPVHGSSAGPSVRGMLNVLKHLKMIEGEIEPQHDNLVPSGYYERVKLMSSYSGMLLPLKLPGDPVRKGEIIGIIHDLYGHDLEQIASPADGYYRVTYLNRRVQAQKTFGEILEPRKKPRV